MDFLELCNEILTCRQNQVDIKLVYIVKTSPFKNFLFLKIVFLRKVVYFKQDQQSKKKIEACFYRQFYNALDQKIIHPVVNLFKE